MQIGIIGAGNVGAALGGAWAARGHEIKFGVRQPQGEKTKAVIDKIGARSSAGTIAEAAAFGEVIVLATPWEGTQAALVAAGDLTGKTLLDCTNPLTAGLELEIGHTASGGEQVAAWAPGARVVKIFNTTGDNNMSNPVYGNEKPVMFYGGDDAEAKRVAAGLAAEIGFNAVDLGGIAAARLLEPLAVIWITLAFAQGQGREIAFKLSHR
jgi:predicted dinucleotide-binding enzyme